MDTKPMARPAARGDAVARDCAAVLKRDIEASCPESNSYNNYGESGFTFGVPSPWNPPGRAVSPLLLLATVVLLDVAMLGLGRMAGTLLLADSGVTAVFVGGIQTIAMPLTVVFGWIRGGYQQATLFRLSNQLRAMAPALVAAWTLAVAAAVVFNVPGTLGLVRALGGIAVSAGLLCLGRIAVAAVLHGRLGQGIVRRSVVVGAAPWLHRLATDPTERRGLIGIVDDVPVADDALPYLGRIDQLFDMIQRGGVDRVLIAETIGTERLAGLLHRLAGYSLDVLLVAVPGTGGTPLVGRPGSTGVRLVQVLGRPIGGWRAVLKAAEDYALAAIALVVLAIPMLTIAAAIRLDSPGPVLFRQRRVGLNQRDFYVLKFRTMYHHAADHDVRRQVLQGDPRVTRVGAFLRKTSLDELPQVFNVLAGEMSFVGPRPHAAGTRAGSKFFDEVIPEYAARHCVNPGLTGLAQVRGWRGATETEEKLIRRVKSDLEYIERWSLWLDLAIILRTVVVVIRMRNAF